MSGWRHQILEEFQPEVARLTLAADPDGLLLEEGILRGIEERGFDLIPFEDPIAFRYAYESRYRSHWDRGETTELVVVLRSPASDLRSLPYDLLQAGRTLSFRLADLFPHLSLPIVEELDRSDLDPLYEAQRRARLEAPLSAGKTLSFVLRHVFKVAPETIRTEADLLAFLLEWHYTSARMPPSVERHLSDALKENPKFREWPLEIIIPDQQAFLRFVQERWPIFLDTMGSEGAVGEAQIRYGLEIPGPELLPFDEDGVRAFLDNLFVEGLLEPVSHPRTEELARTWAAIGVRIDPKEDRRRRCARLLETIESTLPSPEAGHREWQAFAPKWARLVALRYGGEGSVDTDQRDRFERLRNDVDQAFLDWIREHYSALHNQPPDPPVMLHHVPRMLARRMADSDTKMALVVLDGLALDQWLAIHQELDEQNLEARIREEVVFAWLPTVTSVSRQACFAGRPPLYFPGTITRTSREPKLWTRFWVDEGLSEGEIQFAKSIRRSSDVEQLEEVIARPKTRVLGLVVDQIDRISHGMELGTAGMHNQVRQWIQTGVLAHLLSRLLDRGFHIFLTSDHGNVEARGIGRSSEGSVADVRGQRVRVFPDPALRSRVQDQFPGSIPWPPVGLPDDYLALFAPGRSAFVLEDEIVVAHGGLTLEEVLVPLVEIGAG